jgi:hypothetical protein
MMVPRYGRWTMTFDRLHGIDCVVFTAPNGTEETRPTFDHQPAGLARGPCGNEVVHEGTLACEPLDRAGVSRVSPCDRRWFPPASVSAPCPISPCLCSRPPHSLLPKEREHPAISADAAMLRVRLSPE